METFIKWIIIITIVMVILKYISGNKKSSEPVLDTKSILNAMGDKVTSMTLHEIQRETGLSARSVIAYLKIHKIKIADYDGTLTSDEILAELSNKNKYGIKNDNLVCPHCQTKGSVRSMMAEEITSTKVVPIIGNNIKSKKSVTQMHCDNCDTTWNV